MTKTFISLSEAAEETGYTKRYLTRIFTESGLTRFGRSENYLMDEFVAFFKFRSKVRSEPRKPGESKFLRNQRIRLNWRKELKSAV